MRPTVFQRAELRDENDNIVQQGTYGKGSALSNSTNDGWVDYVMNNLEALRSMSVGAIIPVETLPESGETGKAYVVTTGTDAGKLFMWDGEDWVEITGSIGDYLPITGGTITGNLVVEGISTSVTPNADDNSTKVATTEYVQNEVKPIETDVDIAEKDIANIKALLQGHLYDYQTDSTSAYTKSVPIGAMPYAGLEKVGGKTIVYNQLCGTITLGDTTHVTKVSDGVYTINGIVSDTIYSIFEYNKVNIIVGHKYYLAVKGYASSDNYCLGLWTNGGNVYCFSYSVDNFTSVVITANKESPLYIRGDIGTYDNVTLTCKCIDLTLMFGAGNEPTKEQFESMFPADTYSFSTGTLLSAGVTEVVSKDANDSTLQTISIPTAIRNLEGYGWSAGSVYNYVDFERKVFVQNVGKVEFDGTETWTIGGTSPDIYARISSPADSAPNQPISIPAVCDRLTMDTTDYFSDFKATSMNFRFNSLAISATSYISITNKNCTTATDFQSFMNGAVFYYELATPIETDISAYITDDNLIEVEAGGTLTLPNSNGTDYQIPVPSEEEYMIDLQEAINNG